MAAPRRSREDDSLKNTISNQAQVFRGRPLFALNMMGGFWLGLTGYFALLASFVWHDLVPDQRFHNDRLQLAALLATGLVGILVLIPGRLFAMWPYAITIEPQKGIWLSAPPIKLWIPLDEIVDIDVYSGIYGNGRAIQLNRSHGLVKEIHILSLAFPDERVVHELRAAIDRRDGVVQ